MMWMILSAVLSAVVAYVGWQLWRSRKEWALEEAYYRRHDKPQLPAEEAKAVYGADPNVSSGRQERKAAEQSREVYERTVEKLKTHAPKTFRRLNTMKNAELENSGAEALPIFAGLDEEESFREVAQQEQGFSDGKVAEGSEPSQKQSGDDVITFDEVRRRVRSAPLEAEAEYDAGGTDTEERAAVRKPDADLPVITLEEVQRIRPFVPYEERVEASAGRYGARRDIQTASGFEAAEDTKPRRGLGVDRGETPVKRPSEKDGPVEIIGVDDIRSNLLKSSYARSRQARSELPPMRKVIREAEVLANLERTSSSVVRRLRRVSTADHFSVLPSGARVDNAHGSRVVPKQKSMAPQKRSDSALSQRFAPYSAVKTKTAEPLPQASAVITPAGVPYNAAVIEPPKVAPVPPVQVDIAPYASFEQAKPLVSAAFTESEARAEQAHDSVWDERLNRLAAEREENEAAEQAGGAFFGGQAERPVFSDGIHTPDGDADETEFADEVDETEEAEQQADEAFSDGQDPRLPSLNLLLPAVYDPAAAQSDETLLENGIVIEEKLAEYRVKVKVLDAYAGPVITRYEIEPDVGVRGSSVMNLERDLARSLGVSSIRVVETIPGKTCMGLELPNPKRQMIRLSEIFASEAFQESKSKLTLALGQDITGQPVVTDLAKAPHLLVAGTTGSGKSVGVNAMILSMLFKAAPEDVRLIMIDPKMLELSIYEGIPHLLAPVVTDMKLAANALNWCVNEMERRYRLMSWMGVRNLVGYNKKIKEAAKNGETFGNPFSLTPDNPEPLEKLPYIVVVVDEFADLMMTAGKQIEQLIARITQKARAAGIHLILATQRPSVDVITGLIKANIPTRIAFQVSSKIDSRTILDQMGAEALLGQGDMLFLPPGTGYPQRVHGAFASDEEVHEVVEFLKTTGTPDYIDEILSAPGGSDDMFGNERGEGERDPLYDEAVACVIKTQKASISSVQRYLRIGYNRAANLVEQMEEDGIVSAADHSGKRSVLARSGE